MKHKQIKGRAEAFKARAEAKALYPGLLIRSPVPAEAGMCPVCYLYTCGYVHR